MLQETSQPYSNERIYSDMKQIETLHELLVQQSIPMEPSILEILQQLMQQAGTKSFYPSFSTIHYHVLKLKWAREGCWNTGYYVPWMSLYNSMSTNNRLSSIATQFHPSQVASSHSPFYTEPLNTNSPNFRAPLGYTSQNSFGNGARPVELKPHDWNMLLKSLIQSKEFVNRISVQESNPPLSNSSQINHSTAVPILQKSDGETTQELTPSSSTAVAPSIAPKKQRKAYSRKKPVALNLKKKESILAMIAPAADVQIRVDKE